MDQYDILLDEIIDYKDREIVLNQDDQISAYDFYLFLRDEFKGLSNMCFYCEELVRHINKNYSLKQLIERKVKGDDSINKEIKDFEVCGNDTETYLYLFFTNYFGIINDNNYIKIVKDRNNNQLYIKEGFYNDEIIKNNYEKILEIFDISEYYSENYGDVYYNTLYPMISFNFEDEVISLRINCDIYGNVDTDLCMVKDKDNYIERTWVRDDVRYLSMILHEDKSMLMKRFKINISTLDSSFQRLILKHREKGISQEQYSGLRRVLQKK